MSQVLVFLPAKLTLGGFSMPEKGIFENLFTKNAENARVLCRKLLNFGGGRAIIDTMPKL